MSAHVAPVVDCVVNIRSLNGEGAFWSQSDQLLYWVDVPERHLHQHDPATGQNQLWVMPEQIGCCATTADGDVIVALASGFHRFSPTTGELSFICGPAPTDFGHRFSEGTVDPRGRFLAGTSPYDGPVIEDKTGRVFSLNGLNDAPEVLRGFHTINGMAFSPDGKTAYASDSFPAVRRVWAWDYDADDGAWHNKRLFFDTQGRAGRPDGAAIDTEGCYWSAAVNGWQLLRITPKGDVDMIVDVPVERPSKPCFGGKDLTTLYVTSLSLDLTPDSPQPNAGGVFATQIANISGYRVPDASF